LVHRGEPRSWLLVEGEMMAGVIECATLLSLGVRWAEHSCGLGEWGEGVPSPDFKLKKRVVIHFAALLGTVSCTTKVAWSGERHCV